MPEHGSRLHVLASVLACTGLALVGAPADAQSMGVGLPGVASGGLLNGPSRAWEITPTLNSSVRWTDNASLAGGEKTDDWEFRITPGLQIAGRTARASGSLLLAWENSFYARRKSNSHDSLLASGFGTVDLYDRRLLLDGTINMSYQRSSIFGTPTSTGLYDPNTQTLVRTYSLSPYYLIRVPGGLSGELRYRYTFSDSSGSNATVLNNNTRQDGSFQIGNGAPMPFGWSLSAFYSTTSYEEAQDSDMTTVRGTGTYAIDPLFRIIGILGFEQNNFVSSVGQEQTIYGGGFEWTPSPRTRVYANMERRFFGNGYDVEMSWRSPLSAISGRFTRDVSSNSQTLDGNALAGLYLAYLLSIPSSVTDPLERLRLAGQAWRDRGLPGTFGQSTTYVSQSYYLEQRSELAGVLTGVRNSLALRLYQSKRSRLADAALLAPGDDLAAFDETNEIGGSINFSHALTPRTNLMAAATVSRSRGEGGIFVSEQETRRRGASLSASTALGPHTTGGLIYQYNASRGASEYDENSITANIGMRF